MALPAIAAGAARGLAAGRRLAKVAGKAGKRPPIKRPPVKAAGIPREEAPDEGTRKTSALISPVGILMLTLAGVLDFIGALCLILDILLGVGEILSYIPDVIGILFFGIWLFFRSRGEKKPGELVEKVSEKRIEQKKMVSEARGALKKGLGRGAKFGLAALGELMPFLGALPFWTIFVYSELTAE